MLGCPIRKSRDHRLFAPPPSLSQLITSFIASQSLGIHRSLLFAFFILVARTWFRHVTTSWFKYSMHSLDCSIVLHCFTTFSLFLSIYQRSLFNGQLTIHNWQLVYLTIIHLNVLIYNVSPLLNLLLVKKTRACCLYLVIFVSNHFIFFVFSLYSLSTDHCQFSIRWWRISGSNRWPPACKAGALSQLS